MEKVNILGIKVNKLTMDSAMETIKGFLKSDKTNVVYTPNSEIIMQGYRNKAFADILNSADMMSADGIGVVYAAKIVKNPVPERVAGFDMACNIVELAAKEGYKLFFFGSKPGIAETAYENLKKKYPELIVAGVRNGYFKDEENEDIVREVNESGADILFVCLGAPKQEMWINAHKDKLNVKLCMGLGGALDVWAGNVKRAPEFYCKHGLEWFYRLMKQPQRIGRMMDLPKFGFTVLLHGRKYKQD